MSRCAWYTHYGSQCGRPAPPNPNFPKGDPMIVLCSQHIIKATGWFVPEKVPPLYHQDWYVYFIMNRAADQVKIGHSVNPVKRIAGLQTEAGLDYETLLIVPETVELNEKMLHTMANSLRIKGEWFDATAALLGWIGRIAVHVDREEAIWKEAFPKVKKVRP